MPERSLFQLLCETSRALPDQTTACYTVLPSQTGPTQTTELHSVERRVEIAS